MHIEPYRIPHARVFSGGEKEQGWNPSTFRINYFDPEAPITYLSGTLPHWRQSGVTYYVTFRLADSLPQVKLERWRREREEWFRQHPEPHDLATRQQYFRRFTERMEHWLDAGAGSCVLELPEVKEQVEGALLHFDGQRFVLDLAVVASNHVHALVTPLPGHILSKILHSWKSFTAHEILKMEAVRDRMKKSKMAQMPKEARCYRQDREGSAARSMLDLDQLSDFQLTHVWEKESFDHIVRSPASLSRFRAYIRSHKGFNAAVFEVQKSMKRER